MKDKAWRGEDWEMVGGVVCVSGDRSRDDYEVDELRGCWKSKLQWCLLSS